MEQMVKKPAPTKFIYEIDLAVGFVLLVVVIAIVIWLA